MPRTVPPFTFRSVAGSAGRRAGPFVPPAAAAAVFWLALVALVGAEATAQGAPVPRPKRRGTRYVVRIDSAPQQAAIYLDDEKYGVVGYTPYKGKLARGAWKLILKRDGFVPETMDINVAYRSRRFFVVLKKEVLPATVSVSASVDHNLKGAWVHLDGKYVGKVPLSVKVPAGRHQVAVQKKGFEPLSRWVELKPGEQIQLAPALKRRVAPAGSVLVDANVASAEVRVDGKEHPDRTPTVVDGLSPGTHVIEVRGAGAPPWKQAVEVRSGQRLKVQAQLVVAKAPRPGSLLVDADVAAAEVWVDGKVQGDTTPTVIDGLAPGEHDVEVRKPPHVPWRSKVAVLAGKRLKVEAKLVATTAAAKAAEAAAVEAAARARAGTGTIRVLSSVAGAEIKLDGRSMGRTPGQVTRGLDIKFVPVGKHTVEARADGGRVASAEVEVKKDAIVQVPLRLAVPPKEEPLEAATARKEPAEGPVEGRGAAETSGTLKVTASVAGAGVKVDGVPRGLAPLELKLPVGEHVVLVAAPGTTPFSQRARIAANLTTTIVAQLKPGLPDSAQIGRKTDGTAADPEVVGADPDKAPLTGAPPPLEHYDPTMLMRSTLGARPLPEGAIAVDVGAGYPYWLHARVTAGMVNDASMGLDGSLSYRTGLKVHELLATVRYRVAGKGPGILGAFATIGGGGGSGEVNNVTVQGGASATLVFGERVALSGRVMIDAWSDRLCRELQSGETVGGDAPGGCVADKTDSRYSQAAQDMLSGGPQVRDLGLRLLGGVTLEIALSDDTNLFLQGDVPLAGVEQRAAFSSRFNDLMISVEDQRWLVRAGLTFKL